jgi:hypothetical protein
MSVFKTTFSRALRIIPSDNANIPYPTVILEGTNASSGGTLVDTAVDFIKSNVKPGDIVVLNDESGTATVISISDENTLKINADIFSVEDLPYTIYQSSPQTGLGNPGCYLYINETGAATVITIGGDEVDFKDLQAGTILPVQVIKYIAGAPAIALW